MWRERNSLELCPGMDVCGGEGVEEGEETRKTAALARGLLISTSLR